MLRKIFALLVVGLFCISGLSVATMPAQAATLDKLTVNGTELSAGRLYGVDDTTLLQFAILAYVDGQTQYKGKNQNFPGPGGTITPNYDAAIMFDQYFGICAYYDLNLMRIGAGDKWGSQVMFEAWYYHHDSFVSLLKTMAEKAEKHGVYVCVVLAGCAEYPAYTYGGSGDVFDTSSSAYNNYITYARDVMNCLDNEDGIGFWDMMNEPDYDTVYNSYWSSHGSKTAFSSWEQSVASDTASARTKPRCMGVAGQGAMFGWGQSDFNLANGGGCFEILDRHYYAQAQDAYLFADPEQWATDLGKPLFWSELGYNGGGMYVRWPWAESEIYASGGCMINTMVLNPTTNYPYTGGSLVDTSVSSADQTASDIDGAIISVIVGITGAEAGGYWPVVLAFVGVVLLAVGIGWRRVLCAIIGAMALIVAVFVLLARSGII